MPLRRDFLKSLVGLVAAPLIAKSAVAGPRTKTLEPIAIDYETSGLRPGDMITLHLSTIRGPEKRVYRVGHVYTEILKSHGQTMPLIVDTNRRLVDGFHRFEAMKKLGYETARCYVVPESKPEQFAVLYGRSPSRLRSRSEPSTRYSV